MRGILSFAALATMYFPGCTTSKNAVHCLSRWIKVVTRWSKNLYRQVTCRIITGF